MSIIALDMAKAHLRVTWGSEDQLIELYLLAAEGTAADFLNRQVFATQQEMADAVEEETAGEDPIVANMQIQAGMLLILGNIYSNRDTSAEIPPGARDLLWPHRVGLGV
ncbi:head-tail connector protein [Cupriavidus oxalaticus]|uniref:Phage gp6-like head-tail connector protein n=1 Tax=Cupriavidus oxalaticus TaxID=96344 RepID=A0A5P3VLS3_9BURK|nr:head-tail connector protein [Cupriavidus oxalaticus]QEZ47187.1 phage gp6-like head-tail connector protein [Cupriavidus oxalaticus]